MVRNAPPVFLFDAPLKKSLGYPNMLMIWHQGHLSWEQLASWEKHLRLNDDTFLFGKSWNVRETRTEISTYIHHPLKIVSISKKTLFLICHDCYDQPRRLKLLQVPQPDNLAHHLRIHWCSSFRQFHGLFRRWCGLMHTKTGMSQKSGPKAGSISFWSVHSKLRRWETL